jgi:hypothetical protein
MQPQCNYRSPGNYAAEIRTVRVTTTPTTSDPGPGMCGHAKLPKRDTVQSVPCWTHHLTHPIPFGAQSLEAKDFLDCTFDMLAQKQCPHPPGAVKRP